MLNCEIDHIQNHLMLLLTTVIQLIFVYLDKKTRKKVNPEIVFYCELDVY